MALCKDRRKQCYNMLDFSNSKQVKQYKDGKRGALRHGLRVIVGIWGILGDLI